jgi:hypothetical protein
MVLVYCTTNTYKVYYTNSNNITIRGEKYCPFVGPPARPSGSAAAGRASNQLSCIVFRAHEDTSLTARGGSPSGHLRGPCHRSALS